ncbi:MULTISPECIES: hypothetical protein [unclassified Aureimonas]|uniref:hypothetical protein n=1 Tax=unclassified Aureimonas TaxID=2615206 RepID=UPI0006FCA44A|nr:MULTISPECIES: hypothetical protein [unclassified Aureimonas]KQT52244.1 hypothetical protein ASG62_16440 [Aureimonas sp. Leaf427]KQT65752.1 hypothetical protein ASG54_22620 [Aureimonas sp. Leaf460]
MTNPSPVRHELIDAAQDLVAAITFDDSGIAGRGGNGGLISRETIRKADELRFALLRHEKEQTK